MNNKDYLVLDFGGTKHSAALITPGKTSWRRFERALSGSAPTAEQDLEIMFRLAQDLLAGEQPIGIGVSFGGPVDFAAGVVRLSHHVPGWEAFPLKQVLETKFGAPARVDNDANAAALGEFYYGAGRGLNSFLYITVSTGVGGGWILNGRPWRGHENMAGEIGHTVVDPQGPDCLCGKRGCVERYASGPYMAEDIRKQLISAGARGTIIRNLVQGDLSAVDGRIIALAARQGDKIALDRLASAGRAIGVGIGNVANLINPQRFILGGGITKSGPLFWEAVQKAARSTALPEISFTICPAKFGDDAPLWGAVRLAADAAQKD